MTFEFENLGTIEKASIEMGKLTVICGKNNTGKTYLTYAVWAFLSGRLTYVMVNAYKYEYPSIDKEFIAQKLYEGETISLPFDLLMNDFIDGFSKEIEIYTKQLGNVFDAPEDFFKYTKAKGTILDKDIFDMLEGHNKGDLVNLHKDGLFQYEYNKADNTIELKFEKKQNGEQEGFTTSDLVTHLGFLEFRIRKARIFLLTAQRESLPLFKNAINKNARYNLRENKTERIKYALPLEAEIDFLSDLSRVKKYNSFIQDSDLIKEIEEILGVEYHIDSDDFYIKNEDGLQTPSFMASTSVRTLADLHFYLKHRARKGDLLMIDEPELNLHPENQIKIARLLVKLVNAGIKVWITTHSDYIVKELNNCLMLSREFEGKADMMEELGYKADEVLKQDDLRVYIADNGTVERVEYDEYGMLKSSFDEAMRQQNYNADTISRKISRSL